MTQNRHIIFIREQSFICVKILLDKGCMRLHHEKRDL
jgi:hypothetical protein